jgi:ELWxxDGT repeat protein
MNDVAGDELWKSDGTAAGTVLVKDIFPDHSSSPNNLTNVNGTLYFDATDVTTALSCGSRTGPPPERSWSKTSPRA